MSSSHTPISELPQSERPRERLLQQGAAALSSSELIAILLGSGTNRENALQLAQRVLATFGDLQALSQASVAELQQIHGMGIAKITQLLAAFELGTRLQVEQIASRSIINQASDAAKLVWDMQHLAQEEVRMICLNQNYQVETIVTIYVGTINATLLRVAEVFREAVRGNYPAFILVHNHPSGNPTPSKEDIELTKSLVDASRIVEIELVDHIIIGRGSWYSLQEMGDI